MFSLSRSLEKDLSELQPKYVFVEKYTPEKFFIKKNIFHKRKIDFWFEENCYSIISPIVETLAKGFKIKFSIKESNSFLNNFKNYLYNGNTLILDKCYFETKKKGLCINSLRIENINVYSSNIKIIAYFSEYEIYDHD